jgi:hypothetical protein
LIDSALERVLWLGGMSGVGKTTAARALARRHDLRLYSFDAYNYAHAPLLPKDTRTPDEIWVDMTPEELAGWFEEKSRERFPLVLADLLALDDDAPVLVDGPQLLPELVAPLAASSDHVLYVVASRSTQEPLVRARGSGVSSKVRDPEQARLNRLGRDEELARRLRSDAAAHGLPLVEVADVTETLPAIARHFEPALADWLTTPHGDVSGRRRDETTGVCISGARTPMRWESSRAVRSTSPASARHQGATSPSRPGCSPPRRPGSAASLY